MITVFRSSPRKHGNTNALTDVVVGRLREEGFDIREFDLNQMRIGPCLACRACQRDWTTISCAQEDDMQQIFDAVSASDLLILATPIYSWQCTPPMKAMLDRLVYAMNMYYGEERGPSLWEGKGMALITSSGYPLDQGPDLLEEGIRRYCKHSRLRYEGMLWGRHTGYTQGFMDEEKQARAIRFAEGLCRTLYDDAADSPAAAGGSLAISGSVTIGDSPAVSGGLAVSGRPAACGGEEDLRCPCCGQYMFEEKGAYEICPVCGWEDDPLQRRDPDFAGGANRLSLNQARRSYHGE